MSRWMRRMSACAIACRWLVRLDPGAGRPSVVAAAAGRVVVETVTAVAVEVTRSIR